jgi:hypothetical protein
MKDLKLGNMGMGSVAATRKHMQNRVEEGERKVDRESKGYAELKSYVSALKKNVTVRVKHGSGTGELALGKQSGVARLFKGDRSDLTAATLAKIVGDRFGVKAGQEFLGYLKVGDDRFDLHRDKVLLAFSQFETLMGLDKLTGRLEMRDLGTLEGKPAIEAFDSGYPNRSLGTERDGMKLSSSFYGDIVNRGRVDIENGVLTIRPGLQGRSQEDNFTTLKGFFTEKLGIPAEDKERMQNAMNNVLCFFEQNTHNVAVGDACLQLGFIPAVSEDDIQFEGTIAFNGTDLVMKREIRADLKERVFMPGGGAITKETGWRYEAADKFRLPLESALVPHADFKLDALVDARRAERAERGQRQVVLEA